MSLTLSEVELQAIQEEIKRLEALGEGTTLKLSDISKLIVEIGNLKEQLRIAQHDNVTYDRILNRVYEKLYYRTENYAVEAATVAAGAQDRRHLRRMDNQYRSTISLLSQLGSHLEEGGNINKDSPLGVEVRRLMAEIKDQSYWEV